MPLFQTQKAGWLHGVCSPFGPPPVAHIIVWWGALFHLRGQRDCPARDHERGSAEMMDRPWRLPQRVDPCLEYLEDEEIVLRHHARIHDLAFEICIALHDERRCDQGGGLGGKPEVLPQPTAFAASSTVGMLITHSLVAFRIPKVWLRLLITQPTVGGSNSIIVCHDMAIIFARPLWAVVTSTTGPGSSSRSASDN